MFRADRRYFVLADKTKMLADLAIRKPSDQ